MNIDFSKQHVVVTAGASGIGYEIAKAYEKLGAEVYICDVDKEKVTQVSAKHERIFTFTADVGKSDQVEAFFDFIRSKTQTLNVLVNNAGIAGPTALTDEILPDEWDRTVDVNLNGMFYAARFAIPMIKKSNGGSIVNMSSSASYFGFPFYYIII